MRVTNLSPARVYLKDLRTVAQAQTEGRRGEDVYIGPGAFAYLPDTTEVLRSVRRGDLRKFCDSGVVQLHDIADLAAFPGPGNTLTIHHDLHYPPTVVVLKRGNGVWVDAQGTYDMSQNDTFTTLTLVNTTPVTQRFLVRVG